MGPFLGFSESQGLPEQTSAQEGWRIPKRTWCSGDCVKSLWFQVSKDQPKCPHGWLLNHFHPNQGSTGPPDLERHRRGWFSMCCYSETEF